MAGAGSTARVDGWIIKETSQILEQIGTGAEARVSSGNSAICETCVGKQIENVARPDDRRINPGGTPQERNPAEVRHDLEQDTETKRTRQSH